MQKMQMDYIDWGKIRYEEAWHRQQQLFDERLAQKRLHDGDNSLPDCLVACEHYPVLTLGKSGQPANLLVSRQLLASRGVEYFPVDRGGDITFHGPGQIVMYPIFDLAHYGIGLREYIFRIEEAVIRFLQDFGLQGERLAGATGVWLEPHTARARKICAIGVKSSRYVTMHGLALNINTDLSYFSMINPCGFTDKGVTSLQRELGAAQDFEACKLRLRDKFVELF
ncbi:MAG: lipoyl(octanoyl) transferase LipB [Bacteroidales bacterium]|nr:lipoyl(octanoyl) transferase LipB [Bacteroidales bacterium]